jgi:hypothetical protein
LEVEIQTPPIDEGWDFHSLNLRVFSLKFLESIAHIARPMDLKLGVDPDGYWVLTIKTVLEKKMSLFLGRNQN